MQMYQHLMRLMITKPNSININMGFNQEILSSFNMIVPTTIHLICSLILMLFKNSLTTIRGAVELVAVMKDVDMVMVVLEVEIWKRIFWRTRRIWT